MVVLLHGFGSHMGDLAGLCPALGTSEYVYACPNGPIRMPSNLGSAGFAWMSFSQGGESQEAEAAEEQLAVFLEEVSERYRVPPGQVALGGFSQGAILTYSWGLANPHLFRGPVRAERQAVEARHAQDPAAGRLQPIDLHRTRRC